MEVDDRINKRVSDAILKILEKRNVPGREKIAETEINVRLVSSEPSAEPAAESSAEHGSLSYAELIEKEISAAVSAILQEEGILPKGHMPKIRMHLERLLEPPELVWKVGDDPDEMPIERLLLPIETSDILHKKGIHTIGSLVRHTSKELQEFLTRGQINTIQKYIKYYGRELRKKSMKKK